MNIDMLIDGILDSYARYGGVNGAGDGGLLRAFPNRAAVVHILGDLQNLIFPGFLTSEGETGGFAGGADAINSNLRYVTGTRVNSIIALLTREVQKALVYTAEAAAAAPTKGRGAEGDGPRVSRRDVSRDDHSQNKTASPQADEGEGESGGENDSGGRRKGAESECPEAAYREVRRGLCYRLAEDVAFALIEEIPNIRRQVLLDAKALLEGDPAAGSEEEVILSYPGLQAILSYRIAHFLSANGVPVIPRIMSEHTHGKTGIDINPKAVIGERFFIDHGTGVVIGETCVIGSGVKIYQGVTLGALSVKKEMTGKRHPTIEDDVTIYAGATILGGETVIGRGSVIGGNTWITKSVPPMSVVGGGTARETLSCSQGARNEE